MTMTDTETRYSLLELDNAPKGQVVYETPEPEAKPEPVRTPGSFSSPGVSAEGAERAKVDEQAAEDAGFSLAPPIYEIGSLVNQWGVDNFRESRSEFEAMPTAVEACERLIDQVAQEQREDVLVSAPDLSMLPDGRINRGAGALPMTARALTGLCTFVTPGGGRYLRECPPTLRAENVNHWLERAYKVDARASRKARDAWARDGYKGPEPVVHKPVDVTLRTRQNHSTGARENFAVVGPRYAAHDIDTIAEQVMTAEAIPADARGEIVYDGYKARLNVLFHSNIQPEKAVAGEIFKAGILVRTADDGTGSIQIGAQVWRNLCLNLIIIDHDVLPVTRRKHVGKNIGVAVEEGIAAAMAKVQHFADAWSEATMENVLDKYEMTDVEAVFRGLIFNRVVHVPNVRPQEMHERLMRAWQAEPGYSKTAIVNAVTRAAHTNPWSKWTDVEDLEQTGGDLLFQQVWNVALPEDVEAESLGF